MKSPDKFRSDVLRVCSAASIAADENLVTGAQGFFADLRHIFDGRIESPALFQCFLMVIEAFSMSALISFLTLSGLRRRLLIGHQILKLLHECIDILEFAIYGSKTDICDLIELAERIHHDVADLRGRKLTLRIVADRMFHQIDDLFDLGRGYIRLFTGSGDTVTDLGSIEKLTLAILLMTRSGSFSTVSYVVKRRPQERH